VLVSGLSDVLLRAIEQVPLGLQFKECQALAQKISARQPVAILENDGPQYAAATREVGR
jgi:hypothetical protein